MSKPGVHVALNGDFAGRSKLFLRSKRKVLVVIKLLVSSGLVYWVLRGSNLDEIVLIMRNASIKPLVLALVLSFVPIWVRAYRWQILLLAQGVNASMRFLLSSSMVSFFLSNFLPSTIGGDAVRVYDSWRIGNSKSAALAVIVMDRFLGVIGLILLVIWALPLSARLTAGIPSLYLWVVFISGGILLVFWTILKPPKLRPDIATRLRSALPKKLQSKVEVITGAILAFKNQKNALSRGLVLSVVLQALIVIHFYFIAVALNFHIGIHLFFLIIPIAIFVMMIPASINGIGLREGVFVFFFGNLGIASGDAVAFAWLAYGFVLIKGIIGGVFYICRR